MDGTGGRADHFRLQGAIQGSVDLQDTETAGITPTEDSHAVLGGNSCLPLVPVEGGG